jgi:hypothetical protein
MHKSCKTKTLIHSHTQVPFLTSFESTSIIIFHLGIFCFQCANFKWFEMSMGWKKCFKQIFNNGKWKYLSDQTRNQLDFSFMWTRLHFKVFVFVLSGRQLFSCKRQFLCYHCLLVVAMTASKRLVSLGRKLCLFVHYVKQVDNKQWVAKDATNIEWRGRVRRCMTIQEEEFKGKWRHVCCFGWLCCRSVELGACRDP